MDGSRKLPVLLIILFVHSVAAQEKLCLDLSAPENGSISTIDSYVTEGTNLTFSCDSGYILEGASSIVCQSDGTWTALLPSCKKLCPELSAPENGSISTIDSYVTEGTNLTFSCDSGYILEGASSTVCQSDGTWTALLPSCSKLCPELSAPKHGSISTIDSYVTEDTNLTFSCESGYLLEGASSTVCQNDGTWTALVPSCTKLCTALQVPDHGSIDPINYDFTEGTTLIFTCDSGYLLEGVLYTICQSDGTWTASVPSCTKVCPALLAPDHGSIDPINSDFTEGTTLMFSCDSGYLLEGISYIFCQSDGTWTASVPNCAKLCPAISAPYHGSINPTNSDFTEGTTLIFTCRSGYLLEGISSTVCQIGGTWTASVPNCKKLCPALVAPDHGSVNPFYYVFTEGSKLTFTCDSGYLRKGVSTTICQSSGTWTASAPTCTNQVALKSHHGKYLCAYPGGRVVADRLKRYEWETFTIEFIYSNKVALKSYHGLYLCAYPRGKVVADREERHEWERFTIEYLAFNKVALKSYHGKYLCAYPNGKVVADREERHEWERFTIERL